MSQSAIKPGYRTTELAVTVLTEVGLVLASSASWLPPKYAALGAAVSAAAYALARGIAKTVAPPPAPAPVPPAPTPTQ